MNFSSFIERRQVFYKPIEIVALNRRQLDIINRVIASNKDDGIVVRDAAAIPKHFIMKRLTVGILLTRSGLASGDLVNWCSYVYNYSLGGEILKMFPDPTNSAVSL